jgi:hypothetical protein
MGSVQAPATVLKARVALAPGLLTHIQGSFQPNRYSATLEIVFVGSPIRAGWSLARGCSVRCIWSREPHVGNAEPGQVLAGLQF